MPLVTRKTLATESRQQELEIQLMRRLSEAKNRNDQEQSQNFPSAKEQELNSAVFGLRLVRRHSATKK